MWQFILKQNQIWHVDKCVLYDVVTLCTGRRVKIYSMQNYMPNATLSLLLQNITTLTLQLSNVLLFSQPRPTLRGLNKYTARVVTLFAIKKCIPS